MEQLYHEHLTQPPYFWDNWNIQPFQVKLKDKWTKNEILKFQALDQRSNNYSRIKVWLLQSLNNKKTIFFWSSIFDFYRSLKLAKSIFRLTTSYAKINILHYCCVPFSWLSSILNVPYSTDDIIRGSKPLLLEYVIEPPHFIEFWGSHPSCVKTPAQMERSNILKF